MLNRIDRFLASFKSPLLLIGRLLLLPVFLPAGIDKIQNYDSTASVMEAHGLPEFLLPPTILLEILGSVFVALGLLTRPTCLALALFSIAANVIFNAGSSDTLVQYLFTAEFAIVGGLLVLVGVGAGNWSLDAMLRRRPPA
jgi:putative oxidoreductase